MRRLLDRIPRVGRRPATIGLLPVLVAIFAFNLGSAAWSAVVAGRLTQDGAGTALLGALYAICEISGLANGQVMLIFVLSALPAMAVYVGMPALVLGASKAGRDGWSLAWLGLAGGAGGALGPWTGGLFADSFGLLPVLLLFAAGSALMLPIATLGALPPRTAWAGWSALAGRGLPWQALAALGLASAADAGRAALVPNELLNHGQPLAEAGMLLTAGCAVAGLGFLVF